MAPPLLALQDVSVNFGGAPLLDRVQLVLRPGERACLVGRNGSGKSTLLKLAAGLMEPDRGERFLKPGASAAYLAQEPEFRGFSSVADYVAAGGAPPHRAAAMLDALKLGGERDPEALSGGEARRAGLARALACDPAVLLLDEPTNHLDLPAIEWLEDELARSRAAFIIVSHDRRFLARLTRVTFWLDRGTLRRLDQGFAAFEAWSDEIIAQEEAQAAKRDRLIARESGWLRTGVTARRRRNQGRLRRLLELRREREEALKPVAGVKMGAGAVPLSGRLVVEATNLTKRFDGRPVVSGFSTRILRGDRIGVIGPNGAGKTTLLRLLTGALAPEAGQLRLGANLRMVYLDQGREALEPERTPWQILCEGGGDQVMVQGRPRHVVSYLRDFLFLEAQARTPVDRLSGGERNRLLLARALARPSNFLVLDEPTNDLDMETLDLLQEMLADYPGTLLLVSHDRDFLDRVVTATIASEGGGLWREYAGGYGDYLRQHQPGAADKPPAGAKARRAPAPRNEPARRRLGYQQGRDLERLARRIAALQEEIAEIERTLGDPALFSRDPRRFAEAADRLGAARDELVRAEEAWLELELAREEIEGPGR